MKLEIKNLDISFQDKKILQDVSIQVQEGEFVSIIGPSGCGKSSLLNIMAGVLKQDKGIILVDDEEVKGISDHFAYMPQSDLLMPWSTILDNVCLYGRIHKELKEHRIKALENMEAFGLKGYEQAYPSRLSGGMRQRAAFLRTALCSADIMLLDEPFGALDVITREDMQDWLLQMRARLNKTTILVTHDIDEAIFLSDRILVLGGTPAHIVKVINVSNKHKTREWLYSQSTLHMDIYRYLKGEIYVD